MAVYTSRTRDGWKTVDDDGTTLMNFKTKREATQDMVARSAETDAEAGGDKGLPDNYRPALAKDVPEGRACGNCKFFDESNVSPDGTQAWCTKWEDWADGGFYCNKWEAKERD
jgi:hypothetical protein